MVRWIFTKRRPVASVFGLAILALSAVASILVFSMPRTVIQDASTANENGSIEVGGVVRPLRDVRELRSSAIKEERLAVDQEARGREQEAAKPKQVALALNEHPAVARVHGRLKNGDTHAIGLHSEAPAFDLEAYKSARAGYLEQYLPNRMYQCAQPNENIPPLAPVGSSWQKMNSGESVRLEVKSSPGYPVTYVATDLGAFQNKLNAITVESDGKGIAQATYTATPGTIGRSHVIVGSPGASGQVKFEMLISPIQN